MSKTIVIIYLLSYVHYSPCIEVCESNYIVSPNPLTRFQAHNYCRQRGLYLVSFVNVQEMERILYYLYNYGHKDEYYWMDGIHYWTRNESLWWYDSEGRNMVLVNWCKDKGQPQEPNGNIEYRENCVALNYRGDNTCWHDYPCFTKLPFICGKHCTFENHIVSVGEFCPHSAQPKTAYEADQECQYSSLDRVLFVLNTAFKFGRFIKFRKTYGLGMGNNTYWTSLRRTNGKWYWNSTRGREVTWSYWQYGKDNTKGEDCAVVVVNSNDLLQFHAKSCNDKFPYVCE